MSLMSLSKPTATNEAGWREAQMWLREMAGMGLHKIESIMDGMTLNLPTKLKSKISVRAKSLIGTAAGWYSLQDPGCSMDRRSFAALQSDSTSASYTTR